MTRLLESFRHSCHVCSSSFEVEIHEHDDSLWCWGANSEGQLGIGLVPDGTNAPTQPVFMTWMALLAQTAVHKAWPKPWPIL